ncbi:unnamed protein product [Nippostrongylus brasiliensis]|uniref:JmjC domain-containing protein n=1 Tax=Nippostrongylus brasiliensis TaxID=27835 RepID=A0A0N4YRV5_NIPBR|nr:unnamed protein product [Nippostrongylus brasiliensis]
MDLEALYKEADAEVTRVNFSGDLLLLPSILVHSEYVFRQVVSSETYYSLSEEARTHLRHFLPPIKNVAEEQHALSCAFTKRTDLIHGNPISRVQFKLKNGWFNPDRPCQQNQIRDNNKVLYDHYIRFYHMNLLNKLVKSRHLLFVKDVSEEDCNLPITKGLTLHTAKSTLFTPNMKVFHLVFPGK